MKKNGKKLLSLVLALVMCLGVLPGEVLAADTPHGKWRNLTWTLDSAGTLTISGSEDMAVPSWWYPWADYDTDIKYVVIGNGVTSIGENAFSGCENLTGVSIPGSVTAINYGAFSGCKSLTSVDIPDGVTTIGQNAFWSCTRLANVTISDSVTSIGSTAFMGCENLKQITIPGSMTEIGNAAFTECTGLTSVTIQNGVTKIGDSVFSSCTGLTSVSIPNSVTGIAWGAFGGCTSLTDVYYAGTQVQWNAISIESNNDPLRNATIHFNNTVPNDKDDSLFPAQVPKKSTGYFHYYGPFNDPLASKSGSYTYNYDEVWFDTAATTYQHDLARMSIRMAMAGFGNGKGDKLASLNIRELMQNLGFQDFYVHYAEPSRDSIGYIIGAKNVRRADGTEYSLINVTIRGGGYGMEWGGNFNVGSKAEHEGWTIAKNEVIKGIEGYLNQRRDQLFPDQKIWIQGYSRSSAVMNLVAKEMDLGKVREVTASKEDIYAYGFEVPQSTSMGDRGDLSKFGNIFNIANPIDLVPKVVPAALSGPDGYGYGRYGTTYYLPYPEGTKNYKALQTAMYNELVDIASSSGKISEVDGRFSAPWGMATSLDVLTLNLSAALFGYTENYEKLVQEDLILLSQKLFVKEHDLNEAELAEAISEGILSIPYLGIWYAVPTNTAVLSSAIFYLAQTGFTIHYAELCMAWLDSLDAKDIKENSHPIYRKVFVNCPVDVQVYDEAGALAGEIVNGKVVDQENSDIYAYIDENDQMVVILPVDGEYQVKMTATDTGTVTYTATEYNMDKAATERVVSYQEVGVEAGDTLTGTVKSKDNENSNVEYPLVHKDAKTGKSTSLKPEVDQSETIPTYSVEVKSVGNGTAGGGGAYAPGEFAKVTAAADDGESFLGWYVNGALVSTDAEYRFLVNGDVSIGAVFSPAKASDLFAFTDVPAGAWYHDAVYWAVEKKITNGTSETTFTPDRTCTQTEILTFLWRAAGEPESKAQLPFTVNQGLEYAGGALRWALEKGMIDKGFDQTAPCTRSSAVKFIWQAAGSPAAETSAAFTDVPAGAGYAQAVAWAVDKGVTNGTGAATFSPGDTCTRAQIVTLLYRAKAELPGK